MQKKACDTEILARDKRRHRGKQVLKETGFEMFDSYLLPPPQPTLDCCSKITQCHPFLVTYCSYTPFQTENTQKSPQAWLGWHRRAAYAAASDGWGEVLSIPPVALPNSGTIYFHHTPAPAITMNAVVKSKSLKFSLANETGEFQTYYQN